MLMSRYGRCSNSLNIKMLTYKREIPRFIEESNRLRYFIRFSLIAVVI